MTTTKLFNLDKTYSQDLAHSKDEIFPIVHILI